MTKMEEIQNIISEYEHHYAEALANEEDVSVLSSIYNEIKELKKQLNTLESTN